MANMNMAGVIGSVCLIVMITSRMVYAEDTPSGNNKMEPIDKAQVVKSYHNVLCVS